LQRAELPDIPRDRAQSERNQDEGGPEQQPQAAGSAGCGHEVESTKPAARRQRGFVSARSSISAVE
jgi:hypothetical protein